MPINHHAEGIYRATLAAAVNGLFTFYSPVAGVITRVDFISVTAPSGGDAIFDVNTHATIGSAGVSIFAAPTDRPKILSGQTSGYKANLAAAVVTGQKITVDADVIPSDIGQELVCIIAIEERKTRQTYTATTATLADGASGDVSLDLGKSFIIHKVETDYAAWVRIYNNAANQTLDAGRAITTDPAPGSGVISENITTASVLSIMQSPQPVGSNQESPVTNTIPVTITNRSGASHAITVTITATELEL